MSIGKQIIDVLFTPTARLLIPALLLGFVGSMGYCMPMNDGLSLGLELAQPQSLQPTSNTPAIEQILADNIGGEFSLTEQVLGAVSKLLETFALQQLNQADLAQAGHEISSWLAAHGSSVAQNPLLASKMGELEFIFGTFGGPLMQLIRRIITERPAQANSLGDLAFRCEQRPQEIQQLNELASKSSIYRILMDVFSNELYAHCLRRKMATLRLNHVEPPAVLRQLVDVYLELPLDVSGSGASNFRLTDRTRADHVNRMYAEYGQNFQLERAVSQYGPVAQAANLVMLNGMGFGSTPNGMALAEQFKNECASYTSQLLQHWGNFDQVAAALSSETNNLVDFNNRFKLAHPHLIYASVCNQLTSRLT